MAQDRTDRFVCGGCGKQFASRYDLLEHEQACEAKQALMKVDSGTPLTRTAGGKGPES